VDPAAETALARHGDAVATAREFALRANALRVVLLIDRGEDDPPLMVDCDAAGEVEVTDGEAVATIPADAPAPAPAGPLPPDVRAIPATAISVDLATSELHAPLGAIEHLAEALTALARDLGHRSVATAEFATSDPDTPITLAAREGEPAILAAGDQEYRLGR
jgi:hypothetical protein